MDYETLLKHRRAIRDFQDREVPLAVVEEILRETCLAPTASNRQPCKFIVVRDRERMRRLSDVSKRTLLADLERNPDSPAKAYEAYLRDPRTNVFYNAPCLVFILGPEEVRSLDVDCGLTAAYFMFAATARGLGTCWIGLGAHLRDPEVLAELGVPAGCRIVAPLILGYPTAVPPASERHAPEILKVL
jgi:nitroreductase